MEAAAILEFNTISRTDEETARMYLISCNWDVKTAINLWLQKDVAKPDAKKLPRGISMARNNEELVNRARTAIARDLHKSFYYRANNYLMQTPETTFLLPDFSLYGIEFKEFLEKDLIEKSAMVTLEQSGRLNWWCSDLGDSNKLWAITTIGDGNCLLHAASLSIWGFHDRFLILRNALHQFFTHSSIVNALKRRWKWQQMRANKQTGVRYTEDEWDQEWKAILDMASTKRRQPHEQGMFESLEEIHILGLAHLLQRVIIVISETVLKDSFNQPFAPVTFGGIYVPFECQEKICHKVPLVLCYDMAHFSSLCYMSKDNDKNDTHTFFTPLMDSDGALLPVQFSIDPGDDFDWINCCNDDFLQGNNERDALSILRTYLEVIDVIGASSSPENDSEEEIERHLIECINQDNDTGNNFNNRNRATKQLQTLSKQFGSIGKSMSRKLKKNFGSLTKPTKNKKTNRSRLYCAEVHIKRHPYQNELIQNYLNYAYQRFLTENLAKRPLVSLEEKLLIEQAFKEGPLKCINGNCNSYATVVTSYMCNSCYVAQKKREHSKSGESSYMGIGKSKFYSEPDTASYAAIKALPKSKIKQDKTLYLCNSTFFNDTDVPFNNNAKEKANVASDSVEKLISNFDFSSIDVPKKVPRSYPSSPKKQDCENAEKFVNLSDLKTVIESCSCYININEPNVSDVNHNVKEEKEQRPE